MNSIFTLIVSFFQKIVLADFFKHIVLMFVIGWLFALVYSFGKRR